MSKWYHLGISVIAAALLAALLSALGPGEFWRGAGGFFALTLPSVMILSALWRWAGGGRGLAILVTLAFVLRLAVGVGLYLGLPAFGYPEAQQQAGYVFHDSFMRDSQAWELASSDQGILTGFSQDFISDQYGGLLTLSTFLYRFLSPDAHRPLLVLVLTAFFGALGLPFLWCFLRERLNTRAAWIGAVIFAFYPESLLLGGAQMREPFLIGFSAVGLWAAANWKKNWRGSLVALALSLGGAALISTRAAAPLAGVLAAWVWLDAYWPRMTGKARLAAWFGLAALGALMVAFSWGWLRTAGGWDALLTLRNSGWVDKLFKEVLGERLILPFVVGYGLAQPVLPAAVFETTIPLWRGIAVARALGWYLLAPLLVYALFAVWRAQPKENRRWLLLLTAAGLIWLLLSSFRAGGDLWDNPRYRTIFIIFLASLAAWALDHALARRDAWLWRWVAVEVIFVSFFGAWYAARYFRWMAPMPFTSMVGWIVGLSLAVLAGGWVWDILKKRKQTLALR